jgi:hypothetical protein
LPTSVCLLDTIPLRKFCITQACFPVNTERSVTSTICWNALLYLEHLKAKILTGKMSIGWMTLAVSMSVFSINKKSFDAVTLKTLPLQTRISYCPLKQIQLFTVFSRLHVNIHARSNTSSTGFRLSKTEHSD